ncbi:Uncharacterized membrane protein [Chitinophaga jiangningensis]|uniref:Uncharacterized membrane protein n=1 Tax=Chitinophaga jiangningensis TaxID=1419482 RepID=A0A1M6YUZ0_9BACT|nr:DUF2231 domain-containing protein [Chitinophaga jiangningensis]SHL22086.1 Uncharacterized membrane protein [Chitinophaga jiangningensis]
MILLESTGSWASLTGRMHPLLVHLPIGILIVALLFVLISKLPRWQSLRSAIPFTLFLAFAAAAFSCLTGYLLSQDGGYDEKTLDTHFYLGIAVAVISGIWWLTYRMLKKSPKLELVLALVMLVLISITGHYGGTLTHGDNYLEAAMPAALSGFSKKATAAGTSNYKDIGDALLYEDLVQPVLNNRCISCHSQQKLKGGLQLETLALMRKGGENGPVLKDSMPEESEIYKRIILSENDEHRMPPKGKPSLTPAETELLHWWIACGGPAGKKVKDLPKNPRISAVLAAMQPSKPVDQLATVPEKTVGKAPDAAIAALTAKGLKVLPVAENSNYLSITAFTAQGFNDQDAALMLPLKEQLIWLDLSGTAVTDQVFSTLGQLKNLTKLTLKGTAIKGKELKALNQCANLMYLNLVQTATGAADIISLKNNKHLEQLYVGQTGIPASTLQDLHKQLELMKIDTGGYRLAQLPTDTIAYHKVMNN